MRHILITFAFIAMIVSACSSDREDLFDQLDTALANKDVYDNSLKERVNVLMQIRKGNNDLSQEYVINSKIAEELSSHSFDSTLFYLQRNKAIANILSDSLKILETEFSIIMNYAKAGYLVEANEMIYKYDPENIPAAVLDKFYIAAHSFYGESMAYTADASNFNEKRSLRDFYRNQLLNRIEVNTFEWYRLKLEEADEVKDFDKMKELSTLMVESSNKNSKEYAIACWSFYETLLDKPECAQECEQWLVRSSLADVICSTKDYAALNTLARRLFEEGDVDRSFHYLADHCMPDALTYNGKLRAWQISKFFPEIQKAYQDERASRARSMMLMIFVTSSLLVILVILISIMIGRQKILESIREKLSKSYIEIENRNTELTIINSRLSELNQRILETDKVKEEYIAQFLSILSENIRTSRQYKNHVLKSIRQGNTAALAEEINNLPPIEDDILEFYKMFDGTFVNLYPDFVEKFNALLVDGAAIVPKSDDILTPELRIFALIKLGITDSSKIASLLHYSANTIYNYRAKIKNKAKGSRENFEADISAIS